MLNGNLCFGIISRAGYYGQITDAGAHIMCGQGVGPSAKWVDDHVFCNGSWIATMWSAQG